MATWTTPTTKTAGAQISTSDYNNQLVNNLDWLALAPFISAKKSATQSIANSTDTKVIWGTTERVEDITLGSDGSTSNVRFTPGKPGWYLVTANLEWASAVQSYAKVLKNGGLHAGSANTSSAFGLVSTLVLCNGTSDYVEIIASQFSGSAVNLTTTSRVSILWQRFDT